MPNHIHFIIRIIADPNVGAENFLPHDRRADDYLPLQERVNKFQAMIPRSLSSIVKGFKIGVTKRCNQNNLGFQWQRNYYEEIIKNEKHYETVYDYIESNLLKWEEDRNNIINIS